MSTSSERTSDPVDEFRRALDALASLRTAGVAHILVGSVQPPFLWPGDRTIVRFEMRASEAEVQRIVAEHDLGMDRFQYIARDVAAVVSALAQGISREEFVRRRSDNRYGAAYTDDAGVATAKYDLAQNAFDERELRERAWLKETSKTDLLHSLTWDVVAKYANVAATERRVIPYVLLKIVGGSPEGSFVDRATVLLTTDREDLLSLRADIDRVLFELDAAEKEGARQ